MLHSVHIFIDKGFARLLDAVGRQYLLHYKDAIDFNHFYNVQAEKNGKISFEKLNVKEYAELSMPVPDSVNLFAERQSVAIEELSEFWSNDIFDRILRVDVAAQDVLYVFVHLPLYKPASFETAKMLCRGINESARPVNIDFIGYCDDMARFIEPGCKDVIEPASNAVAEIKSMYAELNYSSQQSKFVAIQNRSMNGVSILNDDEGSSLLYDMVANMALLFSAHYNDVFSLAEAQANDVMGIGFSSLYFDKYAFADYLLKKTMLKAIDNQSVNNNHVDINRANDAATSILNGKYDVLSRFLKKWEGQERDCKEYEDIKNELKSIVDDTMKYFESCKDMTAKTAVLAALLSKTECELFSSSMQRPNSTSFEDLYNEAIDRFIEEDTAEYYEIAGEKPVNPIKELQTISSKLIQSEVTIRSLEEQLKTYKEQLENNDKAKECLIDDGFFTFGESKFRMLPSVDEVPLEETYVPHEVSADSADLRSSFSRIKNQGQQGSCLAFTLTSVFEYMMKVNKKDDCDLSEAFLYYNARNLDEEGSVNDDGGSKFVPSLESLRTYGIALEKVWPYNEEVFDSKPSEEAYKDAETRKLIKALNVDRNADAIKSALSDGYPVAASFTLFNSFSQSDGYVPMPSEEEIQMLENNAEETEWRHSYHAMVIVGYSDKLQRFVVRNSWGEEWGDRGYCYIPYSYINDQRLFNFACIITEVASLSSPQSELKVVPALEINNADTRIRYYVTVAALQVQLDAVKQYKARRVELLQYLEALKTIYADPNTRDEFVDKNIKLLEENNLELKEKIKEHERLQEETYEAFRKKCKWLLGIFTAVVIICTLLFYCWNSAIGWIGNEFVAEIERYEFLSDWRLGYIWILPLCGIYALYSYLRYRKLRNEWREERDLIQSNIDNCKKKISANELRIRTIGHKIYAAWVAITSLREIHPKLENLYLKMLNLINNLRVWYDEARSSTSDSKFVSSFPNITLLNKDILDKFFETQISESDVCELNLCENIDKYEITKEYLGEYKADLKKKLTEKLFVKMENIVFNISDHVATDKYSDIISIVDVEMLSKWNRLAGVFLHVKSNERAVIATDNLVFAPNLNATRRLLQNKMNNLQISSYIGTEDKYKMTLVRVATMKFNECVAFQAPAKSKK